MDKLRNNYAIVEVMNILEMGRDQLFYLTRNKRLVKPEIEGKGRGARSKFSEKNIFELAVIKELSRLGIELNFIEEIIKSKELTGIGKFKDGKRRFFSGPAGNKQNLIDLAFSRRKQNKLDKETEDFYLMIFKDINGNYKLFHIINTSTLKSLDIKELFETGVIDSAIFIDLLGILKKLDEKMSKGV